MSGSYYKDYKDLYLASQTDKSKANYKVFLFDVKNSKIHSKNDGIAFYRSLEQFVNKTTADLLWLEKVKGHKILHRHVESSDLKESEILKDKVMLARTQDDCKNHNLLLWYDQINPLLWMGDLMHFIVEAESISDNDFMKIVKENKDNIIPNYDLYFGSAFYETDVWAYSSVQFSRVYCIPLLEELSKKSKSLLTTQNTAVNKTEREL